MSDELDLDLGLATAEVDSVAEIVASMKSTLTGITDTVEASRPYWDGVAAVAFQKVSSEWDEHAAVLRNALSSLEETLRAGYTDYAKEDEEIGQIFESVSID